MSFVFYFVVITALPILKIQDILIVYMHSRIILIMFITS